MGTQFEAGESLRVDISGGSPLNPELAHFTTRHPEEHTLNRGTHKVHFGGEYDSHVIMPFVDEL
jgi:predicted acyl esterase